MLLALKVATAKIYFLCYGIFILNYASYYTGTFPHSCAWLSSLVFNKNVFLRNQTFFIAKPKQIYSKTLFLTVHLKQRNVTFHNLLASAVICKQNFCTKMRLSKIFKTKNTKTFIKTATLKQLIHLSWTLQFLATFYA